MIEETKKTSWYMDRGKKINLNAATDLAVQSTFAVKGENCEKPFLGTDMRLLSFYMGKTQSVKKPH